MYIYIYINSSINDTPRIIYLVIYHFSFQVMSHFFFSFIVYNWNKRFNNNISLVEIIPFSTVSQKRRAIRITKRINNTINVTFLERAFETCKEKPNDRIERYEESQRRKGEKKHGRFCACLSRLEIARYG